MYTFLYVNGDDILVPYNFHTDILLDADVFQTVFHIEETLHLEGNVNPYNDQYT